MIRVAVVGLGKMGLSHLAILGAHPEVEVVAVCDGLSYVVRSLERYGGFKGYNDFDEMLLKERLQAIVIATPSKSHAALVEKAINSGLHVFCEKPFVLNPAEGKRLADMAERAGLVTQVGYHYRFVATFSEAARIVRAGVLGRVHHVRAEAYGPVVLRPKGSTWRSDRNEGGGVVYDYACHAIDLVHSMVGPMEGVSGVIRNGIFSKDVDDEVYCTLHGRKGVSAQLCANWSDESSRKMSTRISVWGENGSVKSDRQECVLYLREPHPGDTSLKQGWSVRNTTELQEAPWFYLRGEEYSRQIDTFVQRVKAGVPNGINDFRSALDTDRVVAMIYSTQEEARAAIRIGESHPAIGSGEGRAATRSGPFGWLKRPKRGAA
jgi:scyllo-inositol 2-dehydrogenase (NADP+)